MAKINMAGLLEDRESGTAGPWREYCYAVEGNGGDSMVADIVSMNDADQRRIARLPDLEEAYIEAVGLLRDAQENGCLLDSVNKFLERNG